MDETIPQHARKRQPRTELIFYVYFLYRSNGDAPFYVGKGCYKRIDGHEMCARNHASCKHLTCRIIRKEWREGKQITKIKVAEGLIEQTALRLEQLFISLGAIYQWPLVNKTIGGEGVSGYIRDEEWRKRRSELAKKMAEEGRLDHLKTVNIGRTPTPEQRKRQAENSSKAWSDPGLLEKQRQHGKHLWENPEYRQKQLAMMNDPIRRAKHSEAIRGKESVKAKTYPGFISSDGTIYENVKNLTHFSRQHGLQVSGMCLVAQGKQSSHLGWTCYPPLEVPISFYPHSFASPDGIVHTDIPQLTAFCKEHGLTQNVISEVASGKRRSYKGWTKHNS